MILTLRSATASWIEKKRRLRSRASTKNNLHGHFDLGLVAWPPRTRGEDCGVVVLGKLLVGAVDTGFIAARCSDAGLEVVADDRLRHEGVDVGPDPVGKPF